MPRSADHNDRAAFAERAASAVAADVRMFSGCKDEQTSADVSNVASFGLPANSGPGGAGGACTNGMVLALTQSPQCNWVQLLTNMQHILKQKGYTQVPQLSSSREIALQGPFQLMNPHSNGRSRALYIGINYVGQQGELRCPSIPPKPTIQSVSPLRVVERDLTCPRCAGGVTTTS